MPTLLEEAREIIDGCGAAIAEQLARRNAAVGKVLEYKIANDLPAYDPVRHQAVIDKAGKLVETLGGDPELGRVFAKAVADYSMEKQKRLIADRAKTTTTSEKPNPPS